jgi:hypothetical protein
MTKTVRKQIRQLNAQSSSDGLNVTASEAVQQDPAVV